jgi:hypothetical protein
MFFRIIKSNNPLLLFVIPFVALLMWLGTIMHPVVISKEYSLTMPFVSFLGNLANQSPLVSVFVVIGLLVLISFYLMHLNTRFMFIKERTYLPAVFYILLASSYLPIQSFNPALISSVILIFAFQRLFKVYRREKLSYEIFDSAVLISLASMCYAPASAYFLIIWIALLIFRSFSWREWLLSLVGFVLPYFLGTVYCLIFSPDPFMLIKKYYSCIVAQSAAFIFPLPYLYLGAFLILLLLLASIKMIRDANLLKVETYKAFLLFLWIFLVSILLFFMIPSTSAELLYIAAIPMSFLFSYYYNMIQSHFWGEFVLLFIIGMEIAIRVC